MKLPDSTLHIRLLELLEKWLAFVNVQPRRALTDYEQGFIAGFGAATVELQILVAQVKGLDTYRYDEEETDFEILPDSTEVAEEPEWEYLYVRFEQTAQGEWFLKDLNGFWHSPWKNTPTFGEAVEQLRNREGWRLVSFAKGIHVFRRPRR